MGVFRIQPSIPPTGNASCSHHGIYLLIACSVMAVIICILILYFFFTSERVKLERRCFYVYSRVCFSIYNSYCVVISNVVLSNTQSIWMQNSRREQFKNSVYTSEFLYANALFKTNPLKQNNSNNAP